MNWPNPTYQLSLELLCADDFGAGYRNKNNRTSVDHEHIDIFNETLAKHEQLREEAVGINVGCFVARTDDRDSRHSDAYLYFGPDQAESVALLLQKINLPGDILDLKGPISMQDFGSVVAIANREFWNLGDGWDDDWD